MTDFYDWLDELEKELEPKHLTTKEKPNYTTDKRRSHQSPSCNRIVSHPGAYQK